MLKTVSKPFFFCLVQEKLDVFIFMILATLSKNTAYNIVWLNFTAWLRCHLYDLQNNNSQFYSSVLKTGQTKIATHELSSFPTK